MEKTFYEKLACYRRAKRASVQTMSDLMGINRNTYMQKEKTGSFYFTELLKACEILELDLKNLLFDKRLELC